MCVPCYLLPGGGVPLCVVWCGVPSGIPLVSACHADLAPCLWHRCALAPYRTRCAAPYAPISPCPLSYYGWILRSHTARAPIAERPRVSLCAVPTLVSSLRTTPLVLPFPLFFRLIPCGIISRDVARALILSLASNIPVPKHPMPIGALCAHR